MLCVVSNFRSKNKIYPAIVKWVVPDFKCTNLIFLKGLNWHFTNFTSA